MLEFLGSWTNKSKVAGSPIEEFRFGSVRVARIHREGKSVSIDNEIKTRSVYQWRITLPGVGCDDIGFEYTMSEAKRAVEDVLGWWLAESGIQELFNSSGATQDVPLVMPDSIVVLEGLKPAPSSAKIVPITPKKTALPPRNTYTEVKSVPGKKQTHNTRRALTRGQ
jgi:hypothetical protein